MRILSVGGGGGLLCFVLGREAGLHGVFRKVFSRAVCLAEILP